MTKARLAIGLGVTVGVLAVCCGWPDYSIRSEGNPDAADADETGGETGIVDATPYDVPTALCSDAGLRSGESVACACSGGPVDLDGGDVGPLGQQTCTLEGGLGACVGCPPTNSCDGVIAPAGMTCIPGGVTVLGASNPGACPPSGCAIEQPEHSVALSRFFLDEREVTVKRFRDWWKNGHVTPKAGDVVFEAGEGITVTWQASWTTTEPTLADATNGATWKGEALADNDSLPINFVDWPTALAFCATTSTGGRLPTEAEWEAAASGRAGRLFPKEPPDSRNTPPTAAMLPCGRAISAAGGADCGPPAPPVAAPDRISTDGVYDLAGSVAEWVLDVPPPGGLGCVSNCYPKAPGVDPILFVNEVALRGVRGGAWNDTEPKKLRTQARDFRALDTRVSSIGFRCARR